MAKVNLSISVKDEHLPHFSEVLSQLKKSGLAVDQALESVGVVTGSIDSSKVKQLQQLDGVAHVEESREVRIPPPESEVQ